MSGALPIRLLLGPQRPVCNLGAAIAGAGLPDGPLAVISAGWQEAEDDIDDVREIVGRPLFDLRLYARAEELFAADPDLERAHRARQDQLKKQQRLYRMRLKQLSVAARQVLSAEGDADMIAAEQRHAIAQLRALDRHHMHRSELVHQAFAALIGADQRAALERHRDEITALLDTSAAVLITGGNVVIILNRMRLFGLDQLLRDRHVVAWSAGAMVLASRIVLFHDRAPQGRRDAELLGAGLGLVPGHVFLPSAERRLRQKDRLRMSLFSRRFAPEAATTLDSGSLLKLEGGTLSTATAVRQIRRDGGFGRIRAA